MEPLVEEKARFRQEMAELRPVKERLRGWLEEQPDLAAAELGERLVGSGVQV
jgi:hypothetical protein